MMKKQNGITLIALVITIIVLLILAGVSIAMLTGENGILTKATDATSDTKDGEVEEAIKLVVADAIAENLGFPTGGLTTDMISKTNLEKMNNNYTFTTEAEGTNAIRVTAKPKKGDDIVRYVEKSTGKVSKTAPTTTPTTPTTP